MYRVAAVLLIALLGSCTGLSQNLVSSHAPTDPATASTALPPTGVVGRVNGVPLTQADLDEQEQHLFPYFRQHGGRIPPGAEPDIRKMAMHTIVLNELLYQEARRRGMKLPEAKIAKGLQEIRQNFPSPQAYQAEVSKKYGSEADFDRRIRRNLLIRELWDQEVTRKSVVTDTAVRAYYEKNLSTFVRPESASFQSISILFPKDATPRLKSRRLAKRRRIFCPKQGQPRITKISEFWPSRCQKTRGA